LDLACSVGDCVSSDAWEHVMKDKVAILLHTMGGVTEETMISIVSVVAYSMSKGIQVDVLNESVTGVSMCRNTLVKTALAYNFTHVFFIDSDMFFPMTVLEDLLGCGVDIVGVPYVGRKLPAVLLGAPLHVADRDKTSGVVEAETMPSGLILIKTDVFRAISSPWYFESYAYKGSPQQQFMQCIQDALGDPLPLAVIIAELMVSPKLKAWLESPEHGKHGLTYDCSEDSNFVFKARRYGFRAWSNLDIAPHVGHVGKYVYGMKDLDFGEKLDSQGDKQEQRSAP
jgi:hypothetical protein